MTNKLARFFNRKTKVVKVRVEQIQHIGPSIPYVEETETISRQTSEPQQPKPRVNVNQETPFIFEEIATLYSKEQFETLEKNYREATQKLSFVENELWHVKICAEADVAEKKKTLSFVCITTKDELLAIEELIQKGQYKETIQKIDSLIRMLDQFIK